MSAMEKALEAEREETRRLQGKDKTIAGRDKTSAGRDKTRARNNPPLEDLRSSSTWYYFLILVSLLMAYRSESCLNDSVKEIIKRSTDEKLKQALIDISNKDNRFRYCAHLENFFLSNHAACY